MAYFGALVIRVHIVMGLVLGLFFAALGLTGACLAYRPALEERLYWPLAASFAGSGQWEAASTRVLAAVDDGKKIREIQLRDGRAWQIVVHTRDGSGPESLYVNPADGSILSRRRHADSAFDWLYRLHTELLLGRFGTQIVSRLGLLLMLQAVLGLLVWRMRGYPMHLHTLLGITAGILAALLGYSGWSILTKPVSSVTPVVTLRGIENKVSLDEVVKTALARRPSGKLAAIYFPGAPSQPFQFWFGDRPSDGIVYMDPYGAVLPMLLVNGNATMRDWHSGPNGGGGARLLRVFAGLGLALLFVTGVRRAAKRGWR